MPITRRPFFAENDKTCMARLAGQYAADNLHVVDLPYRFSSWAFDDPENIQLWFDGQDRLLAWAVLQPPWWAVDYASLPSAEPFLHPEILAWADQRARTVQDTEYGRPSWYVNVFSDQTNRIDDLEQAGFVCQADVDANSWSKVFMRRSGLTDGQIYKPRAGFTARPLAGPREVEAYVDLHRSVFESKTMTIPWRLRTLNHPAYRADLDIVVEAADGRLGAFCIGWLDEASMTGQIEPLGCHRDFRSYALGRVALSEVLQRFHALGVQDIFVETDSYRNTAYRLYDSLDFNVIRDVLVYRKDYISS